MLAWKSNIANALDHSIDWNGTEMNTGCEYCVCVSVCLCMFAVWCAACDRDKMRVSHSCIHKICQCGRSDVAEQPNIDRFSTCFWGWRHAVVVVPIYSIFMTVFGVIHWCTTPSMVLVILLPVIRMYIQYVQAHCTTYNMQCAREWICLEGYWMLSKTCIASKPDAYSEILLFISWVFLVFFFFFIFVSFHSIPDWRTISHFIQPFYQPAMAKSFCALQFKLHSIYVYIDINTMTPATTATTANGGEVQHQQLQYNSTTYGDIFYAWTSNAMAVLFAFHPSVECCYTAIIWTMYVSLSSCPTQHVQHYVHQWILCCGCSVLLHTETQHVFHYYACNI